MPPALEARGETPLGTGLLRGLDLLESRRACYRANGVGYSRPWLVLMTLFRRARKWTDEDGVPASCTRWPGLRRPPLPQLPEPTPRIRYRQAPLRWLRANPFRQGCYGALVWLWKRHPSRYGWPPPLWEA
jgi:hypothetical protein